MNTPQPPLNGFSQGSPEPGWTALVERVRVGDPGGLEELYSVFTSGVRFLLQRQLGSQDVDDKVHDVFLVVAQSIRRGELRHPERLMGYVRTIVRRHVAAQIEQAVQARHTQTDLDGTLALADRAPSPERGAIEHENLELVMRILNSIATRDREVLIRFYLDDQPAKEICRELDLTETQFRLIKSRAKARFGELGKQRFSLRHGFRH